MTTALDAHFVYLLARCPTCGARYAVAADPHFPGQYHMYHRATLLHSHTTLAGLPLCVCSGVPLTPGVQATQTARGWLPVPGDDEGWLGS